MLRILSVACVCALNSPTTAADWPAWRGPNGDGTTPDADFPLTWSGTDRVKWKTPIPGVGHSSPVVSRGRVFVTTALEADGPPGEPKKRHLLCLDRADGRVVWERTAVTAPLEKMHKLNSRASSTPAADGERVYTTFLDRPRVRVFCHDFAGNLLWDRYPGEFHSVHGFCSTPVLYKDLVIVNADQDPPPGAPAYIVALDKRTGAERWRIDRPTRLRSYCPPTVLEAGGRTQLVLTGAKCVASYDPDTGRQLWLVDGPTEQFVSSVVLHNGLVLLTAGFPDFWVMAIDPTGTGNVSKTHVKWAKKTKDGGYVPSPVAAGGRLFVVNDDGLGTCWDVATGRQFWKERLGGHQSGSLAAAGGRVYVTADDGTTFVLKAGPEFELLAKNPLGERCLSSPAFSAGAIFLRGDRHLFCIE